MSGSIRRATITGRVQGVGYRAWVEHRARASGVQGWVRNRRDGSVEAVIAGSADLVSEMIRSCWRGPSSARVDLVRVVVAVFVALFLRRAGERFSVLSTI